MSAAVVDHGSLFTIIITYDPSNLYVYDSIVTFTLKLFFCFKLENIVCNCYLIRNYADFCKI